MTRRQRQILLCSWTIVWMLAVPLFHVHPEADYHHGGAGHAHSGTVHTVFSGDLDGEFASHVKVAHFGDTLSEHTSHTWQEHSELSFSLLNDSSDRKAIKPCLIQLSYLTFAVMPALQGHERAEQDFTTVPASALFVPEIPTRAPPLLLL